MKKLKMNANLAFYKTRLLKKSRFPIIPNLDVLKVHIITSGSEITVWLVIEVAAPS